MKNKNNMTQTENHEMKSNSNLRVKPQGNYLFLNRKKDHDCDNCGKYIKKRKRVVSRLVIENKQNVIVSYVCSRCR